MARRKTTTRRRRSPKPMLNVLNTAEKLVVANAASRAVFGLPIDEFVLGGWSGIKSRGTGAINNPATTNSWGITAQELLQGLIPGGVMGYGQSGNAPWSNDGAGLMAAVKNNLQQQGPQAVATMILAPIGFKVAKKVLGKPLINPANRILKQSGLSTVLKI